MTKTLYSDFYKGRKVLVTGHTGFKGSWLCMILKELGAEVCGYSLTPPTDPSLFELADMSSFLHSVEGDVANLDLMMNTFSEFRPEIVIHMAAQPLVRESYINPVMTYETNVMGTVNVLECVRKTSSVRSVINVTTDKVYRNNEWDRGYVETDVLDGYDPYSNSKSCSELVTHSYVQSFLRDAGIAVSTCRAGNVLGGGDFAKDRIIPDCIRAAFAGEAVVIRNPYSTRPYQHVLEPLFAYLLIAMKQYEDASLADNYNVGPDDISNVTTGDLVTKFCNAWGEGASLRIQPDGGPHEAGFLKLDCAKLKKTFAWKPVWDIDQTMDKIVEFERLRQKLMLNGADRQTICNQIRICMEKQINEYLNQQAIG